LAALFPDRMLALVTGEVERMANDPLPVAERPPRIAALKRELDKLRRWKEALVVAATRLANPYTARRLRRPRRCWASGWQIRSRAPPEQQRRGRAHVPGGALANC